MLVKANSTTSPDPLHTECPEAIFTSHKNEQSSDTRTLYLNSCVFFSQGSRNEISSNTVSFQTNRLFCVNKTHTHTALSHSMLQARSDAMRYFIFFFFLWIEWAKFIFLPCSCHLHIELIWCKMQRNRKFDCILSGVYGPVPSTSNLHAYVSFSQFTQFYFPQKCCLTSFSMNSELLFVILCDLTMMRHSSKFISNNNDANFNCRSVQFTYYLILRAHSIGVDVDRMRRIAIWCFLRFVWRGTDDGNADIISKYWICILTLKYKNRNDNHYIWCCLRYT